MTGLVIETKKLSEEIITDLKIIFSGYLICRKSYCTPQICRKEKNLKCIIVGISLSLCFVLISDL